MLRYAALCVLVLGFTLAGCKGNDANRYEVPLDSMPTGQKLFLSHCVSCHMGPGDPPGPNQSVLKSATLGKEETFRNLLRHPNTPMMRAFSEQELSDSEIHELYIYLQTQQNQSAH